MVDTRECARCGNWFSFEMFDIKTTIRRQSVRHDYICREKTETLCSHCYDEWEDINNDFMKGDEQ